MQVTTICTHAILQHIDNTEVFRKMAQPFTSIAPQAAGWVFESQPRKT